MGEAVLSAKRVSFATIMQILYTTILEVTCKRHDKWIESDRVDAPTLVMRYSTSFCDPSVPVASMSALKDMQVHVRTVAVMIDNDDETG